MSAQEIERLLHTDALANAEKMTGQSYKDDDLTMLLGFLAHSDLVQAKREALTAADDTHYSMQWADLLRIYASLGFTEVLRDEFKGNHAEPDTFVILWHSDGILATAESYGGRVNTTKIFYNWRPSETASDNLWPYISSGTMHGDVWVGDHDAREGLRHNLAKLANAGTFVTPWVEQPFLWLLTYADAKGVYDYRAINAARFARLPGHVQQAMANERGAA